MLLLWLVLRLGLGGLRTVLWLRLDLDLDVVLWLWLLLWLWFVLRLIRLLLLC